MLAGLQEGGVVPGINCRSRRHEDGGVEWHEGKSRIKTGNRRQVSSSGRGRKGITQRLAGVAQGRVQVGSGTRSRRSGLYESVNGEMQGFAVVQAMERSPEID